MRIPRPGKLGRPFIRWSIRKLADYLATNPTRRVYLGRERLRQLLRDNDIPFQRTRTWKESADPNKDGPVPLLPLPTDPAAGPAQHGSGKGIPEVRR
jgi:hypothetical protein